MPHQCTTCGHTFADGSKEMLSGCPDCGGNTFQFHPAGSTVPEEPPSEEPPDPDAGTATNRMGRAATKVRDFVGSGSSDEAESPPSSSGSGGPDPEAPWPDDGSADPTTEADDSEIIDADARREAAEDRAQSSARGEIASPDEVASGADVPGEAGAGTEREASAADAGGNSLGSGGGGSPSTGSGAAASEAPPSADGRVVSEPTGEQPDIEELREQLNDQFESIKIVEPGEYELNLMELYNREEYIIALQENGRYVIQVPENWLGDRPGADRS